MDYKEGLHDGLRIAYEQIYKNMDWAEKKTIMEFCRKQAADAEIDLLKYKLEKAKTKENAQTSI